MNYYYLHRIVVEFVIIIFLKNSINTYNTYFGFLFCFKLNKFITNYVILNGT